MYELLEKLVKQAQDDEPETESYQQTFRELVDRILRLRRVCRPCRGQALSGVYQSLYQSLQERLEQNLKQKLPDYKPNQTNISNWIQELFQKTYRQIFDDEQLKQLALAAQQQPANTPMRNYALRELVEGISLSDRFCHPHKQFASQSPWFYEQLYQEAINRTLTYVCQKIDTYDPHRGKMQKFMNWVNFRLDKLMIECNQESRQRKFQTYSLEDINIDLPQQCPAWLEFQQLIASYPEGMLAQEHIKDHQEANFQAIAEARFAGISWQELSVQWDIPVPTLSSFFQRCVHKFRS